VLPVAAALLAALTAALLTAALGTTALIPLVSLLALVPILVVAGALFGALSTLLRVAALLLLIAGILVRILVVHICSSRESAVGCRMQARIH
jgi:hypothetical protein